MSERTLDQELCQMESRNNTIWETLLDLLLKDEETARAVLEQIVPASTLLRAAGLNATGALMTWAQMKLIQEARRRELIPEQCTKD